MHKTFCSISFGSKNDIQATSMMGVRSERDWIMPPKFQVMLSPLLWLYLEIGPIAGIKVNWAYRGGALIQ